jgi:hypothetical protein
MADFNPDIYFKKFRKLKRVLLILLPFLILLHFYCSEVYWEDARSAIGIILALTDIGIIIGLLTRKYYNWIFFFLFLVIISIVFKAYRLPFGTDFGSFGFGGLASISFFSLFSYLRRYQYAPFLKYIGFSSSIVLYLICIGWTFKLNHWPTAQLLLNIGIFAFIPFLFAFIFTLPGSNYINWEQKEKVVFYRAIIVPMLFVFCLCTLILVFPGIWQSLTTTPSTPWGMEPFGLLQKAGLH